MTDDLDALARALRAAAPAPDPAAKAVALARAMQSFDLHQETASSPRPSQDRPQEAGFVTGVLEMIDRLTRNLTRGPALAATASVAAIGAALVLTLPPPEPAPLRPDLSQSQAVTGATVTGAPGTEAPGTGRAGDAALAEVPAARPTLPPAPATGPDTDTDTDIAAASEAETGTRAGAAVLAAQAEMALAAPSSVAGTETAAAPAPLPQAMKERMNDTAAAAPAEDGPVGQRPPGTEAFASAPANTLKVTAQEPVATFSADVDTASYAFVRNALAGGMLPPPDAVRIEEMVNYFPYDYPAPAAADQAFRADVAIMATPWNPGTRLVRIGLQGRMPALADRPPLDLVFLIDTSGSMDDPARLPLLVQSFRLMLGQLRPDDRVAIVTYAGSAGLVLEPTAAADGGAISAALERLSAGGPTAGQDGLHMAYAVAEGMRDTAQAGTVSRIILATDGDFNLGISDPRALADYIAARRESGIYLSVLGFGRGNLDDATMQALAQNGNGQAAYVDTLAEAQKVLVDQLTGALFPIADDVKLQVEWNPAKVAEYRLIGYETRSLARADFGNDRVDAAEIGAGHQVTALFEITPVGSPAIRNDPLRYGAGAAPAEATATTAGGGELGYLKLRWKAPGAAASTVESLPITEGAATDDADLRFAAAIAGMGQLLTGTTDLGGWGWDDAIALAGGAKGQDAFGYRAEAVQLMRLAQSLSGR